MHIRFGYELIFSTPVPTHMILMLHTHLGRGQYYLTADRMQISARTAESYAGALCRKLGVRSRIGLVMLALQMGIAPANE